MQTLSAKKALLPKRIASRVLASTSMSSTGPWHQVSSIIKKAASFYRQRAIKHRQGVQELQRKDVAVQDKDRVQGRQSRLGSGDTSLALLLENIGQMWTDKSPDTCLLPLLEIASIYSQLARACLSSCSSCDSGARCALANQDQAPGVNAGASVSIEPCDLRVCLLDAGGSQ